MKNQVSKWNVMICILLFVILGWALSGCSSAETAPPVEAARSVDETAVPQPPPTEAPVIEDTATAVPSLEDDPAVAVVQNMIERLNAGDFAGAAGFFSDDAMIYLIGMPPTGMEIYRGSEQYNTFLKECCTDQNFVYEVTPEGVDDGIVYAEGKTWMDFTRELEVAPNSWHEIYVVRDGKIAKYISTITEESLTKFKPALCEVLPELCEIALPEGETPATEVNITITDGTCAYDGPMTLQAGELVVNAEVQDQTAEKYALSFFTLDPDKDMIDLMASTYNAGPPSWSNMVFLEELQPDESQTYEDVQVEEGLLYMVCWSGPPDVAIGNAGPFVVQP